MRNSSIFSFVREKDQYLDLFSPRLKTNLVFNCKISLTSVIPLVAKYNQNYAHEKSSDKKVSLGRAMRVTLCSQLIDSRRKNN